MITLPLSIIALPCVLAVWAIDAILFIVIVRVAVVDRLGRRPLKDAVQTLTDPYFHLVSGTIELGLHRKLLDWQVRAIAIVILVMLRMVLVGAMLALAPDLPRPGA
jgi:uncharacterized protein YggT (Ycf19 family)